MAKRFKESNVLNKQFVSEKESVPGESEFEIVRQKRFTINPMSPEEAILQMNLLGHNFFMFLILKQKRWLSFIAEMTENTV